MKPALSRFFLFGVLMIKIFDKEKQVNIVRGATVDVASMPHFHLNQEYLVITNNGLTSTNMSGWQISCNTDGWYKHLYRFPSTVGDKKRWWLDPGELIFLFTGRGRDKYVGGDGVYHPQFHFYMNCSKFLWNKKSAEAILWDSDTRKISILSLFTFQNQLQQP